MRAKDTARLLVGKLWEELTPGERRQAIQLVKVAVRAKRAGRRAIERLGKKKVVEKGELGVNALRDLQDLCESVKNRRLESFFHELHVISAGLRDDIARTTPKQEGEQDA